MHTEKCANLSFAVKAELKFAHLSSGGEVVDNNAIIRYKFYLCRNFLDKLLSENLINEVQRKRLENAVIKRLAEV